MYKKLRQYQEIMYLMNPEKEHCKLNADNGNMMNTKL
jgi:hypothetical protein